MDRRGGRRTVRSCCRRPGVQVLARGVFLFCGAVQVPQGDCGKQATEPGSRPQVLHRTGQKGPGGVSWLAGLGGDFSGGRFEEIGQFGDPRILRHRPPPPCGRVTELSNTAATPSRQT